MLCYAFVRSNLEFASQVWFPTSRKHKWAVESIQKSFVKFIHPNNSANNVNNEYQLWPFIERCQELNMVSLNRRRINSSIFFIHDIISGRISSNNPRNQLQFFKITRFTRSPDFIKLQTCRLECNSNSAIRSACKLYNLAALRVDVTLDRNSFRKAINKLPDSRFINWSDIWLNTKQIKLLDKGEYIILCCTEWWNTVISYYNQLIIIITNELNYYN